MKKVFLWMGAMLTMLAMAPSCSDDMEMPEQTENPNKQPIMTIIATQDDDAESRIAYNESNGQINMTWTEGDALIVTDGTNFVEFTLANGAGTNKGTFTPATGTTIPTTWESGTTELMAHYKANEYMFNDYSGFSPLNYEAVTPTQTANGNMDHLKALNYMQSATFTYTARESVNLKFSQMGAIMKLTLSGMGGQTVTSLKLLAEEEVFNMNYNIAGDFYNVSVQTLSLGENEEGITLAADENLTVYMMLGATELTDGKTITLVASTEDGYYSATLNGGKLEAGNIYSLNKEMAKYEFFTQGTGTEEAPYQLSTAADLEKLNSWIKWGIDTENVYFQLQESIDLSSVCSEDKGDWEPIGKGGNFYGTFDGNGKTISNLYINNSEVDNVAFFYAVEEGAVLKDLHVTGSVTAYSDAAGVVAQNWGTVSGCTFNGSVTTSYRAGGIVAYSYQATDCKIIGIIGCTNYGNISADTEDAGGIVGFSEGKVVACYNAGTVSVPSHQGSIVGGACHFDYHDGETAVIGCYDATTSLDIIGATTEGTVTQTANYTKSTVTTNWTDAMTTMNTAISSYGWEYVANTDEATKANEPLKLQKLEATGN